MHITVLGPQQNKDSDYRTGEQSISNLLTEWGHDVSYLDERYPSMVGDTDLLLFFKNAGRNREELINTLHNLTCPKVCWYFDKLWNGRDQFIFDIAPVTDFIYGNDGTFMRRHNFVNTYEMHGETDPYLAESGTPVEEWKSDIGFLGNAYGYRQKQMEMLKHRYGDRFRIYTNVAFGEKLKDLVASVKIHIVPQYPHDDYYWSARLYHLASKGGFVLHPRLQGLVDEGWKEGEHYEAYSTPDEMAEKIDYYLENEEERQQIAEKGQQFCKRHFTYTNCLTKILNDVKYGY